MHESILRVIRIGVIVFWIVAGLSLMSFIPDPYGTFIIWAAIAVLLIHLAEYMLVKFGVFALDNPEFSLLKTLLFGFTHWAPFLKQPADEE